MGVSLVWEGEKHINMAKPDAYADIDFDEIIEATCLAADEIKCLKVCFDLFDTKKQDFLSADDLGEIMRAMGFRPTEENSRSCWWRLTRTARERSSSESSVNSALHS